MSGGAENDRLPLPPGGLAPDDVWWIEPEAGLRLRAAIWHAPEPVGHVVFLTGRTEYIEKVALPAAQFVARGWSVASLDWRGQGLSSRQASPGLKGHVGDFAEFQRDLDAVLASDQVSALTGPRLLVAHSMGGCIAAHALARSEISGTVSAAILSAPMLGIAMNPVMRAAAWLTTRIAGLLGKMDCWPPFGDVKTPYVLTDPEDNVLTTDPEVMAWMTKVARERTDSAIAMPTLGWFRAAGKAMKAAHGFPPPDLPVLCLLGSNERVVDSAAVEAGAVRMDARLVQIRGAEHEVLIEAPDLRALAWQAIDGFMDANQLPRNGSGASDQT